MHSDNSSQRNDRKKEQDADLLLMHLFETVNHKH